MISSVVGSLVRSPVGRLVPGGRVVTRYIRTFDGTNTYGTLNDPLVATTSDTFKLIFATTTTGVLSDLLDGVLQFDAGDLLQLTNCTATIDGTPVADGADISSYLDGFIHTALLTMTGADTVTYLGQNGSGANFFGGELLSLEANISSVVTNYVLDNDSLTTQYARGEASPSAKSITYTNFISSDIELFTYNQQAVRWEGVELVVDGSMDTACGVNWTCGADWTTGAGAAVRVPGTSFSNLTQGGIFTVGSSYLIGFGITVWVAGDFKPFAGGLAGTARNGVGYYTEVLQASNLNLVLQSTSGTGDGSLDNASVKRVLEYS